MNTKNLLIATSIGVLALGSLSFAAMNGKWPKAFDETIKTAVESNNYAALSETAKSKITQEQFTHMVEKKAEHTAIETAVESGDYVAFKNAMIAQIPNEAEFQKMVAAHKLRTETQAKIETAVKNNDFAAFKVAVEAQRAQMVANHPGINGDAPKAPSDAQLQKKFNTLVEYYKANGKLPDVGGPGLGGKGMMGGKWMGDHGPRGGRGGE